MQNPQNRSAMPLTQTSPKALMDFLQKSRGNVEMALPKHLNPDRMLRLAVTCFSTTPALQKCTPVSILGSVIVASQLGLEPGIGGQGYLIPYGKTCTFVPGWQGLVGLLNNSGRATAWTGSVFEGDEFDFALGSAPRLVHRPGPNYGDPERLTWVYACGKVNGSEQPVVEAWPIERIWKHRDKFNKVGGSHYSYQHPEMYARKVVLLQVLKYMPRSIELQDAITVADNAEMGRVSAVSNGVIVDMEPEPEQINPARIPSNTSPTRQPKKDDLVMDATPAPSLTVQILEACHRNDITWPQVAESAFRNGAIVAVCDIEQVDPADLRNLLHNWDAVVADVKGGQQ